VKVLAEFGRARWRVDVEGACGVLGAADGRWIVVY